MTQQRSAAVLVHASAPSRLLDMDGRQDAVLDIIIDAGAAQSFAVLEAILGLMHSLQNMSHFVTQAETRPELFSVCPSEDDREQQAQCYCR